MKRELARRTDWSDTHPALSDRLAAIGQTARVPANGGPSAAQAFLGTLAQTLAGELDARWLEVVGELARGARAHAGTKSRARAARRDRRGSCASDEGTTVGIYGDEYAKLLQRVKRVPGAQVFGR